MKKTQCWCLGDVSCAIFYVLKNEKLRVVRITMMKFDAIEIDVNMGHRARNYHDAVAFTLINYAMS
jgi:hypothetical protein